MMCKVRSRGNLLCQVDKKNPNNHTLSKVVVTESCECGTLHVEACFRLFLCIQQFTIILVTNFVNYVQLFSFFLAVTLFWFEWMQIKLMSLILHIPYAVTIAGPNYIVFQGLRFCWHADFFKLITLSVAKVSTCKSAVSTEHSSQRYQGVNQKEIIACEYKGILINGVIFDHVSHILHHSNILMAYLKLTISEFLSILKIFGPLQLLAAGTYSKKQKQGKPISRYMFRHFLVHK